MAHPAHLSWFGRPSESFLVPAEDMSAVARRRGQGRPAGRRALRASLDGAEHGRTLVHTGTCVWLGRFSGQRVHVAALALALSVVGPSLGCGAAWAAEPLPVARFVEEASARFQLPPIWLDAVISAESGGDYRAISPKGAMGLMQLMPGTWRDLSAQHGLGDDPFDPRANVLAGAAYLRQLLNQFGQEGFLAAYNAGPARYADARAGRRRLPPETIAYVARVQRSIAAGETRAGLSIAPGRIDWRRSPLFAAPPFDRGNAANLGLFALPAEKVSP